MNIHLAGTVVKRPALEISTETTLSPDREEETALKTTGRHPANLVIFTKQPKHRKSGIFGCKEGESGHYE
jgi:hypothetical protein